MVDHGRSVLLLCRHKPHFRTLQGLLEKSGIPFEAVWGAHDVRRRDAAKLALKNGDAKVLLATEILSEGENMPGLGAVVLAEGVSAYVNGVQRVGRGMEITATGDVYILDFAPVNHPTSVKHALDRVTAWEQQGYEVRVIEMWPTEAQWEGMSRAKYDRVLPFIAWDGKKVDEVAA
jgi:superfamily II DNA or RNA helicase